MDLGIFRGVKTEADVVGDPVAVGVAENRLEERDGVGDDVGTVVGSEAIEDAVAEGGEPGRHRTVAVGTGCERSGAGGEFDGMDGEASGGEETRVSRWRRIEGGCIDLGVDAVGGEDGLQSGTDRSDVSVATHLGDEASTGTQSTMDGGESCGLFGCGEPVEGGVGEDRIELVLVGERFDRVVVYREAASSGCSDHGGRGVDAGEDGSGGGELLGESSVSAACIEDVFAGLWIEQGDDGGGEVCDEASVGGVGVGVPGLDGTRGASDRIGL